MLRRMYQEGSSAKKGPRIAICEQDVNLPRDANVRACECPSDEFMVEAGFKEELVLEGFLQDKCPQYYQLTDSFVRRFEYISARNSPSVMYDIYDTSYTMDLEDFTTACKLPQWGNINDPRKSEFRDFLLVLLWENLGT